MEISEGWQVANVIAQMAAAAGTVGAVVLSLWLTLRKEPDKIDLKIEFDRGGRDFRPPPSIELAATNYGNVPVRIVGIRVRWGRSASRRTWVGSEDVIGRRRLPCRIDPGDTAELTACMGVGSRAWVASVPALKERTRITVAVVTATGDIVEACFDKDTEHRVKASLIASQQRFVEQRQKEEEFRTEFLNAGDK